MLTDLISSMVMNGSAWGPENYSPWLPFYNFVPVIAIAGIAVSILTRRILYGVMCWTSSVGALIPTAVFWEVFDLEPLAVFGWWLIHLTIIYGGQIGLLKLMRELKKEKPEDV
ncbi:hypothetical protein ES702_01959 [subsurface metagenome]